MPEVAFLSDAHNFLQKFSVTASPDLISPPRIVGGSTSDAQSRILAHTCAPDDASVAKPALLAPALSRVPHVVIAE